MKLRFYTFLTPSFEKIYAKFVSAIERVEPDLPINVIQESSDSNGDFESTKYFDVLRAKAALLEKLTRENIGKTIFFSDCDIVYLKPFSDRLLKIATKGDLGFAIENLHGEYNTGQILINCSPDVADFFRQIQDRFQEADTDQKVINREISKSGLKVFELPPEFAIDAMWLLFPKTIKRNAISYHATETKPSHDGGSASLKLARMQHLISMVEKDGTAAEFLGSPHIISTN